MNRRKLIQLLGTVIASALMAGALTMCLPAIFDTSVSAFQVYVFAVAGSVISAAMSLSAAAAVVILIAGAIGAGVFVALNMSDGGAVRAALDAFSVMGAGGDIASVSYGVSVICCCLALIVGMLFSYQVREGSPFMILMAVLSSLTISVLTCALCGVSMIIIAPALVGGLMAIASSPEQQRNSGQILSFIPSLIAVLLAVLLVPAVGTTWKPLEEIATKVKDMYDDYFNYTEERVAFSIGEAGYNYYGIRDDEPAHMLGGPANPSSEPVLSVTTSDDILLRGTVRGTYTGYSWEDYSTKSRSLYYDITRLSRRDAIFGIDNIDGVSSAFKKVSASVEALRDASSTLFVTSRLSDFNMNLVNAVYYNSVGEMFLAGNVKAGDKYSFSGYELYDYDALSIIEGDSDEKYQSAVDSYTQLPYGIETGVYSIADALTEGAVSDADKANSIMAGLMRNCKYVLDVDYPPQDVDFVSYFLLDSREGYCSYFATAMAVLCRIEGIPARYVEGYRVYGNGEAQILTGEDAHAWVEVYIKGVGWVSYDPTPGSDSNANGEEGEINDVALGVSPSPSPESTPEMMDGLTEDEPTPPPEIDTDTEATQSPTEAPNAISSPQPTSEPESAPKQTGGKSAILVVFFVLLILLALFIVAFVIKRRLDNTNPLKMIAKEIKTDRKLLIMYRALLTALSTIGINPLRDESPAVFAERIDVSADFTEFAEGFTLARYSNHTSDSGLLSVGFSAYAKVVGKMTWRQKLSFTVHRIFKGIGDIAIIP